MPSLVTFIYQWSRSHHIKTTDIFGPGLGLREKLPETQKTSALTRAVASLTVPGGQESHSSHFFLKFRSTFLLIFPETLFIFFLILALRVGESPTWEGSGYVTFLNVHNYCTILYTPWDCCDYDRQVLLITLFYVPTQKKQHCSFEQVSLLLPSFVVHTQLLCWSTCEGITR